METPGANHDSFRGSPRRNSILSASNIIQAPISTLLEYSGLFRTRPNPSQEAETLVTDDSSGISNGEVAIRIIGNGEQDAETDSNGLREPGGLGHTELLGSATQVDPIGGAPSEGASQAAPGESVAGDAATRDSPYQRYDIQQAARWIEQILPFSLLLLVVFIRQHLQGIISLVSFLIATSRLFFFFLTFPAISQGSLSLFGLLLSCSSQMIFLRSKQL